MILIMMKKFGRAVLVIVLLSLENNVVGVETRSWGDYEECVRTEVVLPCFEKCATPPTTPLPQSVSTRTTVTLPQSTSTTVTIPRSGSMTMPNRARRAITEFDPTGSNLIIDFSNCVNSCAPSMAVACATCVPASAVLSAANTKAFIDCTNALVSVGVNKISDEFYIPCLQKAGYFLIQRVEATTLRSTQPAQILVTAKSRAERSKDAFSVATLLLVLLYVCVA